MLYRPMFFLATLLFVGCLGVQAQEQAQPAQSSVRAPEEATVDRCGPRSVRGLYSVAYDGTAFHEVDGVLKPVPTVFLGQMSIDPETGAITGGGTVSVGGDVFDLEYVNSFVEVGSDCTATATYFLMLAGSPGPAPTPVVERWVIAEGGDRIRAIIQEFPFALHASLGVFERLSPAIRTVDW